MPPARKPARKARARRSPLPWPPRLPVLEQRHLDLIGLGLVAVGVFLAFPLYLRWDGGEAGQAIVDGLTWAVGRVAWATPVALVAAGALLVMRPVLPAGVRPFRAGALCLSASCLGLAVGTLGFGPGPARPWPSAAGTSARSWPTPRTRLFSEVGAHILAVFLFCAARAAAHRARPSRACCAPPASRWSRRRARCARPPRPRHDRREPDPTQPAAAARPRGRGGASSARRRGGGELDGALRYPDLFEAAVGPPARPEAERRAARRSGARARGSPEPHGPGRPDDDGGAAAPRDLDPGDVEFRLPDTRILKRSTAEQVKPDTAGQEKTATRLVEALGHLGVRRAGHRRGRRARTSRATSCSSRPGSKMAKVANLKNDLAYALAATEIRILAPIPGKRAVGVEVPNRHRRVVTLGDVFSEPPRDFSPLTVWLGKDVSGKAIPADLAKMPHLLVAGTTGAGKSGAINAMLSLDPAARDARRGAPRARRPQAGRAQPLRGDPAPAHAGHHQPADGRQRAAEPRARDGVALRRDERQAHALADRAQQAARPRGREGAALHPLRHRRARRPHDGRARRRRGLDHPPGAEGARGRASTSCSPRSPRAWTSSRA